MLTSVFMQTTVAQSTVDHLFDEKTALQFQFVLTFNTQNAFGASFSSF